MSANYPTDFHGLTRRHGIAAVASVMGLSEGSLVSKRSGRVSMSSDDIHALMMHYGTRSYPTGSGRAEFDVEATLMRMGEKRRPNAAPSDVDPSLRLATRLAAIIGDASKRLRSKRGKNGSITAAVARCQYGDGSLVFCASHDTDIVASIRYTDRFWVAVYDDERSYALCEPSITIEFGSQRVEEVCAYILTAFDG